MNKKIKCLLALVFVFILSACDGGGKAPPPDRYFFTVGDVTFSVGDDADEVTARLGECNSSASVPSCAGEGFDEVYRYNGFKIFAHRANGRAMITEIEVTNDTLPTAEGLFIGDDADKITEIYGEGDGFSGGVEYRAEGCRLRFFITDGRVTGIKYLENGS